MTTFIDMMSVGKDAIKFANFRNTAVPPLGSTNVKGIACF